jgi:hypothetical protein
VPEAVPAQVRAAAAVVGLEALGLIAVGLVLLTKTMLGSPDSLARALLDVAFALMGASVLALGGRGLVRLRAAARTPVVVLQLLVIPVSYSLAFQADRVAYGGPILLAALTTLYLLFTPAARVALNREPD